MPRSRSRSPRRGHRSRSRSPRRRSPRRERERHRSRSASPKSIHKREKERHEPPPSTTSSSHGSSSSDSRPPKQPQAPKITAQELKGMSEEEVQMAKLMGFASFNTTKNKKVDGNDSYAAYLPKKRRYRQYMNRRGGFNRPLDFIA
ncbi:U4/U6.U5 tri-snRNP-associated protein 3 [Mytilus galloprovincialis]|uniref:U4/U6.U5 small nuclear ribonucleoprotein 27 kDa protein n=1 Tax=Mytilus galloprovincialis TaxID=29158 RepID=A0A8B6H2X7_MYTGA|nr:U4/U6.U5 tri-snRNP-associated protein 3 [Mytilus galloprovincialis]